MSVTGDVLAYLRPLHPSATVATTKPNQWPPNLVLIERAGGSVTQLSYESGTLRLEPVSYVIQVWSDSVESSEDLAEEVRRSLWSLNGTRIGNTSVGRVNDTAGMAKVPDSSAPEKYSHRHTFGVSLNVRKA